MKRKSYPQYRDSGIPWLGQIPAYWKTVRLKSVARFSYGDSLASENRILGGYNVYGSNGIVDQHEKPNTKGPCLIVGRKGSFGKINYSNQPCFVIDTTYYVDSTQTKNNIRWLYYCLQCLQLDSFSKDTGVPGLAREDAYENVIPFCGGEEQRTIAAFLDRETARIDMLTEKKERQIELLQEKRSTLISHAVTKGLNPDVPMKNSGIKWLGQIPAHWNVDRLKWSIKKMQNGVWGSEPDGLNDIPCIRVADFDRVTYRVKLSKPTIRAINADDRQGRMLKSGDLLIEKSGGGELQPVGVVVLYEHPVEAVCSNFIARVLAPPEFCTGFLTYLHAHLYSSRVNVRSIKQTTGIQNLDSEAYFNERVAIPPSTEQRTISAFLDRETGRIDTLIERIRKSIETLREYRISLISAAVTGKIDVRKQVEIEKDNHAD